MATSIGSSVASLVALSAFDPPIPEPTVYYSEYSDFAETGDGGRVGRGSSIIRWIFALLEDPEMRNDLKNHITGLSGTVCIRTTVNGAEGNYLATMIWPVPEPENQNGLGITLELEFRNPVTTS